MAKTPKLRDRNWRHDAYERPMRIKIITAKLTHLICETKKPTLAQDILIRNAVVLILKVWEMEKNFCKSDQGKTPKDYLTHLNHLRATLRDLSTTGKTIKTGRPGKAIPGSGDGLDLSAIIRGEN